MRTRYLWLTGIAVAVLLTAGGFALLRGDNPAAVPSDSSPSGPESTGGTSFPYATTAPKVTDIPTPPSSVSAEVAKSGVDSLSDKEREAWDKYLAETQAIVRENADSLTTRLDDAMKAIRANDAAALSSMMAPDESPPAGFAELLVRAYPSIDASKNQSGIGVFSVAKITVYFGYSVVRWTDGGIESEHTVAIPMRFINGTWYITCVGSGTAGLLSVQTVRI